MNIVEYFDPLFKPGTVGIVGISTKREAGAGNRWLQDLIDFGFKGNIYPIHRDAEETDTIKGYKIYKSAQDVPEIIDYMFVVIPAGGIKDLLIDCKDKVRFMQLLTSGFGEQGEEGKELESSIISIAKQSGIRMIGPNCIGLYSPAGKVTCISGSKNEAGRIGIASQSGGLATDLIRGSNVSGLSFSKVISIGNSADLNPTDFLEYFMHDPETQVIGLYIEDVKNKDKFIELLQKNAMKKPVIILKGGATPDGKRAAFFHIGAIADDVTMWDDIFKQYGVTSVNTLEEFLDTLLAFDKINHVRDNRVLLVGQGGGATVTASDTAVRFGFSIPDHTDEKIDRLNALNIPPGTSIHNAIDLPLGTLVADGGSFLHKILDIVFEGSEISTVVMHFNIQMVASMVSDKSLIEIILNTLINSVKKANEKFDKVKFTLVLRSSGELELEHYRHAKQAEALAEGIPVFYTTEQAFRALAHVRRYTEHINR